MYQITEDVYVGLITGFGHAAVNAPAGAAVGHSGTCFECEGIREVVRRESRVQHVSVHGESGLWLVAAGEAPDHGVPDVGGGAIDVEEDGAGVAQVSGLGVGAEVDKAAQGNDVVDKCGDDHQAMQLLELPHASASFYEKEDGAFCYHRFFCLRTFENGGRSGYFWYRHKIKSTTRSQAAIPLYGCNLGTCRFFAGMTDSSSLAPVTVGSSTVALRDVQADEVRIT